MSSLRLLIFLLVIVDDWQFWPLVHCSPAPVREYMQNLVRKAEKSHKEGTCLQMNSRRIPVLSPESHPLRSYPRDSAGRGDIPQRNGKPRLNVRTEQAHWAGDVREETTQSRQSPQEAISSATFKNSHQTGRKTYKKQIHYLQMRSLYHSGQRRLYGRGYSELPKISHPNINDKQSHLPANGRMKNSRDSTESHRAKRMSQGRHIRYITTTSQKVNWKDKDSYLSGRQNHPHLHSMHHPQPYQANSHHKLLPSNAGSATIGNFLEEKSEISGLPNADIPFPDSDMEFLSHPVPVLYFSGNGQQLKIHSHLRIDIPRGAFTVEVWVKPEGGQNNPAVIAGLLDSCSHSLSNKGWTLGIQAADEYGRRDAQFFFSLRTDRARKPTIIFGQQRYQPNKWTHISATYNSQWMLLYINGIQVSASRGQSGPLHSPFMSSCRQVMLGGDRTEEGHEFRGYIGSFSLWNGAKSQEELNQYYMHTTKVQDMKSFLVISTDFSQINDQWEPIRETAHPAVETMLSFNPDIVSPFLPPPCGQTICDNVDIITSYNIHWPLRSEKQVLYRVVNICEDDGSNPTVTQKQIEIQHKALIKAFDRYNISWELTVHEVHNSSLRRHIILVNCEKNKIGNGRCEPECDHALTGYDGGDCRKPVGCYTCRHKNRVCNMECNNMKCDFDEGDCCDPKYTDVRKTCFDPDSPYRAYMSVKEMKEELHLTGADYLNIYFANSAREELVGAATWPWDKHVFTHLGGVVLNPSYYGRPGHTNAMIHELGHVLGLYHVFKGVTESDSCSDPCRETVPSMETGDLCEDTVPTPRHKLCQDPGPFNDSCGQTHYYSTPFNNYMSYTDDDCTDSFTPNQVARMHCYLDLLYDKWSIRKSSAPVPMPPMVIGQTEHSLTIYWLPPISGNFFERDPSMMCGDCGENGVLYQYASSATSSRVCDSSGYWTPEEAVGPPDVDQPCEPSLQAWSPEIHIHDTNITIPCPMPEGCMLELRFLHPVIPASLTLWATFLSMDVSPAISNIDILTDNGEPVSLGSFHVFCDMPLTIKLTTERSVHSVKIYTFDEKMEIDAALLTSKPSSPFCSACRPVMYQIMREPPFSRLSAVSEAQTNRTFTDMDVIRGYKYNYQVRVISGTAVSDPSPILTHTFGDPYCGDYQIQENLQETCDDGNLMDGDGCSRTCQIERDFHCTGEPSLCYLIYGDGVCETPGKGNSINDCGFHTPSGFMDQWASRAYASHQDENRCPVSAVVGQPSLTKICKKKSVEWHTGVSHHAWFPCTAHSHFQLNRGITWDNQENTWLKVCFDHPVVTTSVIIYLAFDGEAWGVHTRTRVALQLIDTSEHNHSIGSCEVSCQHNPLVINITPNLSLPFYTRTVILNFTSPFVAVAGVALRTFSHPVPSHITNCNEEGSFGPQKHSCVQKRCENEKCKVPEISHASVNCTPLTGSHISCLVICDDGFALKWHNSRRMGPLQVRADLMCIFGKWDQSVSCEPIDCGLPDHTQVYYATFSCPEGSTIGKHCSFFCNPPAKLQGGNNWLTCLEDGLWSFPEAYCKLKCDTPPVVANADVLAPRCHHGGHDVGSICRYKCQLGYHVTGSDIKSPQTVLKLQCLEGGIWEEGACVSIQCESPPPVFEGMYECTNGFEFGSQCTLNCDNQWDATPIYCTEDGTWSDEFILCENLEGQECIPPPEVNFVEYSCEEGYEVGAVCVPSCLMPPSDPVVLPENLTADTVEYWMNPAKAETIVCTGKMKWYPAPEIIHCIQSCEPFLGDGWCDTINNRAYCQYDGGDCCSSTLSSKKVVPFAVNCDEDECSCRDPNAEENRQAHKQWGLR
ncbi:pappalysin-2 [Protopterus annectens]|uniref:pappalysin-2 n=1 Tax=Protopterus annectens TaxID=7888 RepID=UPI001CFB7A90|nr:pappalysin-2 [Protopterus annectens]